MVNCQRAIVNGQPENQMTQSKIQDVEVKELVTHTDERGYFREILRTDDAILTEGFGQLSVSQMNTGVIKAWHIHQKQIDWWYVAQGLVKLVLYDKRPDSNSTGTLEEWLLGDNQPARVVKVPPGVAHGCQCRQGPAQLFYVTSHLYDPADEGRIPYDDAEIGYDWLKQKIT